MAEFNFEIFKIYKLGKLTVFPLHSNAVKARETVLRWIVDTLELIVVRRSCYLVSMVTLRRRRRD